MENRIKCGNCRSEYHPRSVIENENTTAQMSKVDYSCPVCGHGKFSEAFQSDKQILKDHKIIF